MKNIKMGFKSDTRLELDDIIFEDSEYALLEDYYKEYCKVKKLEPFKKELKVSYVMEGSIGESPKINISIPKEEDIIVLLYSIRAFVLQKEDYSYFKILNILKRRIHNEKLQKTLEYNKQLFMGEHSKKVVQISINDYEINSEEFLQLYLNGFEYHRDKSKRDFHNKLFSSFPEEIGRFFVISLIIDKVTAICNIGKLLGLIFGDVKEFVF